MTLEIAFRYMRRPELLATVGVCRSKADEMVRTGLLPKPYSLGKRAIAWRSDEVAAALDKLQRVENTAYAQPAVNLHSAKKSAQTAKPTAPERPQEQDTTDDLPDFSGMKRGPARVQA